MRHAFRRMRPLLGTYVEVGTFLDAADPDPEKAFEQAFLAIEKVHKLLSFHDPESDLSRLNYSAGEFVTLDPVSVRVLRLAKAMSRASGCLFDPTVGASLQVQGFLPDHSEFYNMQTPAEMSGSIDDIEIQGFKVRLRRPFRVVLDGLAKGFAVDQAVAALRKATLKNGWVNAGGDLKVFGDIVMPLQVRRKGGLSETLGGLQNCSVATSSVYEKYDKDFPGRVVSTSSRSPQHGEWTVLAKNAWRADSLTKVASLCTDEEREAVLARLGGRCL